MTEQHEAWEMKPRKLSVEEIEHPESVLHDFFTYAHLPQVRAYLWESTKTLVTGTYSHLKSRERSNLLYFHEQLERLIEVAHVLYERDRTARN